MESRKGSARALLLMISASLFVVCAIAVAAYFSTSDTGRTGITLPGAASGRPGEDQVISTGEGFVAVTKENAASIVNTLNRPDFYHQTLYKQTIYDDVTGIFLVHIWARDGIFKLILTESGQTRHILTDGKTVHLWYEDDPLRWQQLQMPEGISVDDLSGILTYESVLDLTPDEITEAEYIQLSDQNNAPCLLVSSKAEDGVVTKLWIDLTTGLLCKAEQKESDQLLYSLHQTDLVLLDATDAALNGQMLLPDGSNPFTIAGS